MLDALRNKNIFGRMVVSVLPLLAVCNTLLDSAVAALILILAQLICFFVLFGLKKLLSEKTAPFAILIIGVGVVGVLSMVAEIFFSKQIENLGIYVPLMSVSAVLMFDFALVTAEPLKDSFMKTLGVSLSAVGFLVVEGALREFFGSAAILGIDVCSKYVTPIGFLTTPAGGFLVAAILFMVYNLIVKVSTKEVAA